MIGLRFLFLEQRTTVACMVFQWDWFNSFCPMMSFRSEKMAVNEKNRNQSGL